MRALCVTPTPHVYVPSAASLAIARQRTSVSIGEDTRDIAALDECRGVSDIEHPRAHAGPGAIKDKML